MPQILKKKEKMKVVGNALKNPRHEKFAQKIAAQMLSDNGTISPSQAYSEVYGSPKHMIASQASHLIHSPNVRDRLNQLLVANNLPIERALRKLSDKLDAKKGIYFEGEKVDTVDNDEIQMKAVDRVLELHNAFPNKENVVNIDNRSMTINEASAPEHLEKLNSILSRFEKLHDDYRERKLLRGNNSQNILTENISQNNLVNEKNSADQNKREEKSGETSSP